MKKISILLLIILTAGGCSFLPHRAVRPKVVAPVRVAVTPSLPAVTGRVIQPVRLAQGGKLVMVPFTAGMKVVASDELDRISLMVVKGMAETLKKEGPGKLTVVFDKDAASADFAVQGHITQQKTSRVFKSWGWRKLKKEITVSGRLIAVQTQEPVLSFKHTRTSLDTKKTFSDLSYEIGQDLAKYIVKSQKQFTWGKD